MNTPKHQILLAQNALDFLKFKRALRKLHLPYKIITLHTCDGRKRKAFRVSSATHVFLATLKLLNAN